jgi:hypothetical protein
VLGQVAGFVVLPDVADIFQEQQGKDVVFVDRRIDHAPEGVAGAPRGFVDLGLGDWCRADWVFMCWRWRRASLATERRQRGAVRDLAFTLEAAGARCISEERGGLISWLDGRIGRDQ